MAVTRMDEQWIRRSLAILEMSAGAISVAPAPTRRAFGRFAELARGLAERAPAWLAPWPILDVEVAPREEAPVAAVSIERSGARLIARETTPAPDRYAVVVVLEYYLHLVHDHLRACRLAARRPGGVAGLLPGEEAEMAGAFEDVDQVLRGAAGPERLDALWGVLAEPV